jgi:hypothetical protein
MKARSCDTCRKQIHKEEQEAFLKKQYAVLKDASYTFACYATAAALAVQMQKGRSKNYIKKMFDDMVTIYDTSSIFGKKIVLTEVIKQLEKEYEVDFSRIHVNLESEKEFCKGVKAR